MLCRSLPRIASSEESTIASYKSLAGMKFDFVLAMGSNSGALQVIDTPYGCERKDHWTLNQKNRTDL